jgi:hypothetical protein
MFSVLSSFEWKRDGRLEDLNSFWMTQRNEIIQGFERGSVTSHSVENSLWKRVWTCYKTLRNTWISGCSGFWEHPNTEGNFTSPCDWTSKGPSQATAEFNIDRLPWRFLLFWLVVKLSTVSDYWKHTNITNFWMSDAMWLADPLKTTRHHVPEHKDIHVNSSENEKFH